MLIKIEVVIGKKKVKLSFFIKISPGIFPKKGIFEKNNRKTPVIKRIKEKIISITPNSLMFKKYLRKIF